MSAYLLHIAIIALIYIILAVSTHLLVRIANQISLGQAAFFGIGAYITAMCTMVLGLSLVPSLLIIMATNALFALLLALPSVRLKGDYFVMATLAFQFIVYSLLYNWEDLSQGPGGITGIPNARITFIGSLSGPASYFILSLVLTIILLIIFYRLQRSPFGLLLRALREDELSLQALGRNTHLLKLQVFMISGAFIGWASYLYATYMSYIDPSSFNLQESIFILIAVLLGGSERIYGTMLGALIMVALPEILRFAGLPDSVAAPLNQVILGTLLIILVYLHGNRIFRQSEIPA